MSCIPDPDIIGSGCKSGEIACKPPVCSSVDSILICTITACRIADGNYTIVGAETGNHRRCYSRRKNYGFGYHKRRIKDNDTGRIGRITYSYIISTGAQVAVIACQLPTAASID